MARTFKNPTNGHTEEVGISASVLTFLFGALYLAIKGQWKHVFIWLIVVGSATAATGGPGIVVAMPLAAIIYAFTIQGILASDYLHKGWIETSFSAPTAQGTVSTQAAANKTCPFCAETIKAEAKVCRFCQREQPASPANTSTLPTQDDLMAQYGITLDGQKFRFGEYRYDTFRDALNYAKRNAKTAATS